jgi:hypothetical protein
MKTPIAPITATTSESNRRHVVFLLMHLVITCTIIVNENFIRTYALIDCGATGIAFMDESFACRHQVPLEKLSQPRVLEVIDGRPIES